MTHVYIILTGRCSVGIEVVYFMELYTPMNWQGRGRMWHDAPDVGVNFDMYFAH